MSSVLTVLHVIVCLFLIAVILLQRGKGAEIGAVFGGGASSTVFGSRGAGNFLTRLTTGAAIVFMLTSLSLSYLWTESSGERLFDEPIEAQPVAEQPLFEELGTVPAEPAAPETPADTAPPSAPPAAGEPTAPAGESP